MQLYFSTHAHRFEMMASRFCTDMPYTVTPPEPYDAVHQSILLPINRQAPSDIIHINLLVITAVVSILVELNIVIYTLVSVPAL